ncbi:hypothetical protein [Lichenicoccus sp.]|uniref:hypothetical protein n=1 Tax=Lichenicoccus sp. TaxID=2781899 RepID=UPI003D119B70
MHDCSGTWDGLFSYPRRYDPTSFVAELRQASEWLTGSTQETAQRGLYAGSMVTANLMGKIAGRNITLLKTYDRPDAAHDAVRYIGELNEAGTEIDGTWVNNSWSGRFLMIRARKRHTQRSDAELSRLLVAARSAR